MQITGQASQVRHLALSNRQIGPDIWHSLNAMKQPALTSLNLTLVRGVFALNEIRNVDHIDSEDVPRQAAAHHALISHEHLQVLSLAGTDVHDSIDLAMLSKLTRLNLFACHRLSAQAFASFSRLAGLCELSIAHVTLNEQTHVFAACTGLQKLSLLSCNLRDADLQFVSALQMLRTCNICNADISSMMLNRYSVHMWAMVKVCCELQQVLASFMEGACDSVAEHASAIAELPSLQQVHLGLHSSNGALHDVESAAFVSAVSQSCRAHWLGCAVKSPWPVTFGTLSLACEAHCCFFDAEW